MRNRESVGDGQEGDKKVKTTTHPRTSTNGTMGRSVSRELLVLRIYLGEVFTADGKQTTDVQRDVSQ